MADIRSDPHPAAVVTPVPPAPFDIESKGCSPASFSCRFAASVDAITAPNCNESRTRTP